MKGQIVLMAANVEPQTLRRMVERECSALLNGYIALEGEYQLGALRLPEARTGYLNADGKLLGTDELVAHE